MLTPNIRRATTLALINNEHKRKAKLENKAFQQAVLSKAITDLHTIAMPTFNIASIAIDDTITLLRAENLYHHRIKQLANQCRTACDSIEADLFYHVDEAEEIEQSFYLDYLDAWQDYFAPHITTFCHSIQRLIFKLRPKWQKPGPASDDLLLQTLLMAAFAKIADLLLSAIIKGARETGLNVCSNYNFSPLAFAADRLIGQLTAGNCIPLDLDHDCDLSIDIITRKAVSEKIREQLILSLKPNHPHLFRD